MAEVERQYRVTRSAVDALLRGVEDGTAGLPGDVTPRAVRSLLGAVPGEPAPKAGGQLDATFVVQLFAVFETACRRCWTEYIGSSRERLAVQALLRRLRDRSRGLIDAGSLAEADRVREARNGIVHGGDRTSQMDFVDAKQRLGRFLGGLPQEWVMP
ncbi:hypothetical protein [Alienimonas chondri]|uniref:RiboL-PSP-HEPN domain-containing protein n=1 Tax=Alienimonas chondri TaxID=2681879 RepID=A0ABX1VEZ8_9PLAN|nr:hypothetical protein [Alienimonas chondri]NNJ25621.1 hypothetical protein [Alienimonas chondri]